MRIASFNVENLFERAVVLNRDEWVQDHQNDPTRWEDGKALLNMFAELNSILAHDSYTNADKVRIIDLLKKLGLERSDENRTVTLRRNKGALIKRPKTGGMEVVANGRGDWIGWVELNKEPVNEVATFNTAQVWRDVNADVLVVVEAESRVSLKRFNEQLMLKVGGQPYDHVMLIDGNDSRGIDVGLMARGPFKIDCVRSHVDDQINGQAIFSRDCPEYWLETGQGEKIVILANHFKSKGYGTPASSNAKRLQQAQRVRDIYDQMRAAGVKNIVIAGDLNDTPDSAPLAPLLANGSDLKDVTEHPNFVSDDRPGTFGNGTKSNKIDYLLFSPELFAKITKGGIFRKGVWGGKNGTLWPIYPEMKKESQAGSDHAAIWAELDL